MESKNMIMPGLLLSASILFLIVWWKDIVLLRVMVMGYLLIISFLIVLLETKQQEVDQLWEEKDHEYKWRKKP